MVKLLLFWERKSIPKTLTLKNSADGLLLHGLCYEGYIFRSIPPTWYNSSVKGFDF